MYRFLLPFTVTPDQNEREHHISYEHDKISMLQ